MRTKPNELNWDLFNLMDWQEDSLNTLKRLSDQEISEVEIDKLRNMINKVVENEVNRKTFKTIMKIDSILEQYK